MNIPTARAPLPSAPSVARAVLAPASAVSLASVVPSHSDRAAGVRPATRIPSPAGALKLDNAPLSVRELPTAACGDDTLMSQPQ
jgi:hypothetical protein